MIHNPSLARALRLIQEYGARVFYEGEIADAIVDKVWSNNGVMTHADLAEFEAEWVEPITTNYHGYDVFQLPPPGQGWAALEMLNILEVCAPVHGIDLAALGPTHPDYWHFMVEAKKLAYSDLQAYNADPKFAHVPLDRLLSKEYAVGLCDRIDLELASDPSVQGGLNGGTIYLTTADRWGNMVSLIHSVFSVYGSGATVGDYGFVLHNRGTPFSLDGSHPNVVAPRKWPFHSIIAGFVMQDGNPIMTFGNMGGSVQPGDTRAAHGQRHRPRDEYPDDDGRRALHAQPKLKRFVARAEPLQTCGSGARGEGPPGARRGRRVRRRLPGHSVHARPRTAATNVRTGEHRGRPSRERGLPRGIRPPQGRAGRRLVRGRALRGRRG